MTTESHQPQAAAEHERLRAEVERAAQHYYHTSQQQGIDNRTKSLVIDRCQPYVRGPQVLEFGYVDGLWTDRLVDAQHSVDVVEGALRHVEHGRDRYAGNPRVRLFHQLFQEYKPDRHYDTIIAGDMLRYIAQPREFLNGLLPALAPQGRLIVTVPNSRSLHRRVGAFMGMEDTPEGPNARDREVGNLRGYDRYELRKLLLQAGYRIIALHGCFLKPLSSAQMDDWSDALLQAFCAVGDELEDYCWFLYAVAEA